MITQSTMGLRLLCDCHRSPQSVTLAAVQDGRLTIYARTHGERHFLNVPLDILVELAVSLERKSDS